MVIIRLILIVVSNLLIQLSNSNAQKQFNNWVCYDNYRITFNKHDGKPIFVQNSPKLKGSPACISDKKGNLLFYTDGITVWNKNNQIMENGNDLLSNEIKHHDFFKNQTLIIPKPDTKNVYYIFTTTISYIFDSSIDKYKYEEMTYGKDNGLFYSIVDLNKNNGLGKIIKKNIKISSSTSAQVNSIYHANGKDIWVITNNRTGTSFSSILITKDGISNIVTSNFNAILPENYYNYNIFGPLVKSLDGRIIASSYQGSRATTFTANNDWRYSIPNHVEIYNFDKNSGRISNRKFFIDLHLTPKLPNLLLYSYIAVQFCKLSPDGSKLYAKIYALSSTNKDSWLLQFDLNKDSADMINNCYLLDSDFGYHDNHNMQIGPDKKLYFRDFSDINYINVINEPDSLGFKCNIQKHVIEIDSSLANIFPNDVLISDYVSLSPSSSTICEGENLLINSNVISAMPLDSIFWTGPNGFSSTDSNLVFNNATPDLNGWYYVNAYSNGDSASDSIFVNVFPKLPPFSIIPPDSTYICRYGTVDLTIDNQRDDFKYLWSTTDSTSSITVDEPGTYYVTITDSNGCTAQDSVKVILKDLTPEIQIIGNIPACVGDTIILTTLQNYETYNWSTGDTTDKLIITQNTRCSVEVFDSLGCWGKSDEVEILFYPNPKITLKGNDTACFNEIETYAISKTQKDTVIWIVNNGDILSGFGTDTLTVQWNTTGKHLIKVTAVNSFGCTSSDSIIVNVSEELIPEITPNPAFICDNQPLTLTTNKQYNSYLWSTGETTSEIIVNQADTYWLQVTDELNCTAYDTIEVKQANSPKFNIIGNTKLCPGESTTLSTDQKFKSYMWSIGADTPTIEVTTPGIYTVEVTDSNNCSASKSIEVTEINIKLSDIKNIDFKRVPINTTENTTLNIINNNDFPVNIQNIRTQSYNEFAINTNPQLPEIIQANEQLQLTINFTPTQLTTYNDSLIITVNQPCDITENSSITGTGTAQLLVWLPEIITPVDTNLCIPLKAQIINPVNDKITTDFNTTISYEASVFYPNINFDYNEPNINIKISDNLNIGNKETIIAKICGNVLLANQEKTDLIIDKFEVSNPNIDIETQNGSITIFGCAIDISKILKTNLESISIAPNLITEKSKTNLKIILSESTNITIEIYNNYGNKTEQITTEYLPKGKHSIPINLNQSSGLYWLKITTSKQTKVLPIIIMR